MKVRWAELALEVFERAYAAIPCQTTGRGE
jgi:hypothetical protein